MTLTRNSQKQIWRVLRPKERVVHNSCWMDYFVAATRSMNNHRFGAVCDSHQQKNANRKNDDKEATKKRNTWKIAWRKWKHITYRILLLLLLWQRGFATECAERQCSKNGPKAIPPKHSLALVGIFDAKLPHHKCVFREAALQKNSKVHW